MSNGITFDPATIGAQPPGLTYSGTVRIAPYPAVYGDYRTAWNFDFEIIGILVAWLIVTLGLLLLLPTIKFRKQECGAYWFMMFYLWIGGFLMLATYGHGWQEGYVTTRTTYISNSNLYINAQVGLQVGLRGINVTLIGNPIVQANHTISYNERFWWGGEDVLLPSVTWGQGKEGFLGNAGQINQELAKGLARGTPWPILWVAEYFVQDGEWIRWGRYYRMAGYYTFQSNWLAFCVWFLNIFLFFMVPLYGFYGLVLTGVLMEVSILIYGVLITTVNAKIGTMQIPFDAPVGGTNNVMLSPAYSWSFYFTLFAGIAAFVAGVIGTIYLTVTKKQDKITFADEGKGEEMKPMKQEKPGKAEVSNNNQYNYGGNGAQYNYNARDAPKDKQAPYVPPRPKGTNEIHLQ